MAQPLLTDTDPDWAAFKSGSEEYFLNVAGEAIRRYCGWNIFPSETLTVPKLRIGSAGIVMLPSLHVTDVFEVVVGGTQDTHVRSDVDDLGVVADGDDVEVVVFDSARSGGTVLEPDQYVWFEEGYLRVPNTLSWHYGGTYGFIPGGYVPSVGDVYASATFQSGYDVLPAEVKQIAFELAYTTAEMPSGNVKDIVTPGFRLQLTQNPGLSLNAGQCERLAPFKLSRTR